MTITGIKVFYHSFEIETPKKNVFGVPQTYYMLYEDLPQHDAIRKIISISNVQYRALFSFMASSAMNYSDATSINVDELLKADYIDAAKRTYLYIESNKQMPNYINTALGMMSPYNFMDMYSRALNFYADEKYLPAFIYTNSLAGITSPAQPTTPSVPDNLKPYIQATKNCQVNDATIQGIASTLNGAKDTFYYVRDELDYENYYNTRRGAIKTYKDKKGNCCDLAHLQNALLRAQGIPAMYRHVLAIFSSTTTGHVYTRAYENGEYVALDASNNRNGYNNIVSWALSKVHNNYRELPF